MTRSGSETSTGNGIKRPVRKTMRNVSAWNTDSKRYTSGTAYKNHEPMGVTLTKKA